MASYVQSTVPSSSVGGTKVAGTAQEFSIRVPKNVKKKYQVMRFNANLGVDFAKWKEQKLQVKMERENNMKEFKGIDEESPKFGAGSEFGREAKEEARRKKFGVVVKKYKPDDQPWILKQGGKTGKKFKGIREGGVSDNTAYYVFTQAGNGVIEAYPLQEWYKFQPIQRYKALTAEEAEEEFGRRNKIINYFSLMTKKRLRNEDDADLDDPDEVKGKKSGSKKKKKDKELKISEMDDWVDSDDDMDDSDDDGEKKSDDEDGEKKKGKKGVKGKAQGKKKKKKDSDDEAFEESDDGDEEGRELDYISDSSDSASDHEMKANKELKGVAEEDALRKLLNSESEDDEENQEKKDENLSASEDEESKAKKDGKEKEGEEKTKDDANGTTSSKKSKTSKKKKQKKSKDKEVKGKSEGKGSEGKGGDSSSELSPNSTDSDSDSFNKSNKTPKGKDPSSSAGNSRSVTPTPVPVPSEKRKLTPSEQAVQAAKRSKLDNSSSGGLSSLYLAGSSDTGVTEDAVRRYLMRKPMTTTELLHKFKTKKTGLSSEQLVNLVAQILKNIDPLKQTIKNKLYLSIKPS